MSKRILSESQISKWMKLANIKADTAKHFLNESKSKTKRFLTEADMMPMEDEVDGMEMDSEVPDDAEQDMEMMGSDEEDASAGGEVEFETKDDLKMLIKSAVMDAMQELGMGTEPQEPESEDLAMDDVEVSDEDAGEGSEGGDDDQASLGESKGLTGINILTNNDVINEVLKRVIRRLV